jgi:hypothetical protein
MESREFRLTLKVHPGIAGYLREGAITRLTKIMFRFFVRIKLEEDSSIPISEFRFISRKQNKDITEQFKA